MQCNLILHTATEYIARDPINLCCELWIVNFNYFRINVIIRFYCEREESILLRVGVRVRALITEHNTSLSALWCWEVSGGLWRLVTVQVTLFTRTESWSRSVMRGQCSTQESSSTISNRCIYHSTSLTGECSTQPCLHTSLSPSTIITTIHLLSQTSIICISLKQRFSSITSGSLHEVEDYNSYSFILFQFRGMCHYCARRFRMEQVIEPISTISTLL